LLTATHKAHFKPQIFIIDALDECDESEPRDVVSLLETLSINATNAAFLGES